MGLKVLLVDAKKFPRRKACGGCLNRVSVGFVEQLLPESVVKNLWADSISLKKFRVFHHQHDFPIEMNNGGFAVDRLQLDHLLVQQAENLGVTFLSPATAKLGDYHPDHRNVDLVVDGISQTHQTKAVVIASGLGNRAAGSHERFQQRFAKNSRVGVEAVFEEFPASYRSGVLSMAIGNHGYVGLTHIGQRRLHVAAAVDRSALQNLSPHAAVESLMLQSGAPILTQTDVAWKGTPALTASVDSIAENRVFLVGDAAGYVEPFTGEGIRWALESGMGVAPFVASAVEDWNQQVAQDYRHWYRQTIYTQQKLCRRLSAGLKRPAIRWAAHQALRLRPSLADSIIKRLNS